MRNRLSRMMWASCLLGASAIAGCAPEGTSGDEPGGQGITQVQSALGTVVPFGLLFEYGMRVDFAEIQNPTNVNTASIRGLAACDAKSLFVLVPDTQGPFSLFYSSDGGLSFVRVMVNAPGADGGTMAVPAQAKSPEIACDDRRLFTLDANRHLFYAYRTGSTLQFNDGASNPWIAGPTSPLIDHIQGGDGTLYGVQNGAGLHPLYKATTHSGAPDITWSFVSNIGSVYVTGGGNSNVSDKLAWPRRAFTTAPDGTSAFNDTILDGQNVWPNFDTGSERFAVISAATTNLLYALDNKTGSIRLVTITLKEDNCTDTVDNDADGRTDSEDPACVESAAVAFCSTAVNGTYCVDRYQPATFLEQHNQNAGLVTCSNHLVVPPGGTGTPKVPRVGACAHGFGSHSDRLLSDGELAGNDPAGTARYCNMIWPSTQNWDFAWGTSDPCGTIRARNPSGGVVVRAGLFTTTGNNNVLGNCANGGFAISGGAGAAPLQAVFNVLGHGPFGCTITASPTDLPVWSQPFPLAQQASGSPLHCNHTWSTVDLAQFGHGETGTSSDIDRNGFAGGGREHAYDITLPEGTPLYAMHGGTVVMSRDRDVTFRTDCGSSYQGEVWVRNFIGTSTSPGPVYQENLVSYYAHLRRRVVETGQTVRAGQLLGFSGETGCAGGPHVHFAVSRNSNINAHTATSPQFGYHVNFVISTTGDGSDNMGDQNLIDPFGWGNQVAFDPSAYLDRNTDGGQGFLGLGGWSMDLFIDGQRPHL